MVVPESRNLSQYRYLLDAYSELREPIQKRLTEFSAVPKTEYFYELCYCLCTAQSKARNASMVVDKLKQLNFQETNADPTFILRDTAHYIRFHNTKAKNLLALRSAFSGILECLDANQTAEQKREWLVKNIRGLGWKEASHFLRNIGYQGLAIIDRHVLVHLQKCGVISERTVPSTAARYHAIEAAWKNLCIELSISLEEMDLLFWSLQTGEILK